MTQSDILRMQAAYEEQLAANAAYETLRQLGLANEYINYTQARKIHGKWFVDHVKAGVLKGVKRGNRIMYSVSSLNALKAAEMRLAAKRQARSRIEPCII